MSSTIAQSCMMLVLQGSVAVWMYMAWQRVNGEESFPAVVQKPPPWEGLAVCLGLCGAFFFPAFLMRLARLPEGFSLRLVQANCLANLLQGIALMFALLPTHFREKLGWRMSKTDARLAVMMFLASLAPVYGLNVAVQYLNWRAPDGKHGYFQLLEQDSSSVVIVWIAASVIIAAPLVEELMYRVVLQGWLESLLPPSAAMLLVAALFACMHYKEGRPDHIPLFAFALALGYLYHRRRSFPAVVLVHSLFNGLNLAVALLTKDQS